MCGIMGYTGVEPAVPIIYSGLKKLEYRGYDSSGIGIVENGRVELFKTEGGPDNLKSRLPFKSSSAVGIGHTRWATHGAANEINAHPHTSPQKLFTIVHNGIIENCGELKLRYHLDSELKSETDTEVIACLLEREYSGDVKEAITRVMPQLSGSYALGIICIDFPDTLFCAKKSSPLFVCTDEKGAYLASDIAAFPGDTGKIYRLGDGEIGIIKKDSFKVFDTDGCRIRKTELRLRDTEEYDDKGSYEHYMLKEIYEQPSAVEKTLDSIMSDGKIKLGCLRMNREKIKSLTRIELIGCGSAYHAGLAGAYVLQKLLKIPARAYIASEYKSMGSVADENTLAIIISQSGETADTLAAMKEVKSRNAKIVSVVNNRYSTIAQESDSVIITRAGREISVATTKAFSAQLAVLYCIAVRLAYSAGRIDRERYRALCAELLSLPEKIKQTLEENERIEQAAQILKEAEYACFIGRAADYCTAMEGALKLKEVSYSHCEAYAAGELKHGTISLIENGTPVIAVCADSSALSKTVSNIKECKSRGAKIICITDSDYDGDADDIVIKIPDTEDLFSVSAAVIPLQLIAYHTAKKKGCGIDKPKNLAKSVTVE